MKSILTQGTATPYVAIFDGKGNPIIDPLKKMPIGVFVTDFTYDYVDEGPDTGELVMETDNPDLPDLASLGYLMPLRLQWGWILPNGTYISSPVRLVVIKDHKITFSETGVSFTLVLSDSSFLLQTQPANYSNSNKDLIGYVKGLLKGQAASFSVIDYSDQNTYKAVLAKKNE